MVTSSSEDNHSRHWLHLQGSFSCLEEKETFLSRYEAARLLLAPGVNKRNANISAFWTADRHKLRVPSIKEQDIHFWEGNNVGLCRLVRSILTVCAIQYTVLAIAHPYLPPWKPEAAWARMDSGLIRLIS